MTKFFSLLLGVSLFAQNCCADIPHVQPLYASTVGYCPDHIHPQVINATFTYPDGVVMDFNAEHMHGFESAKQLLEYAFTAVEHHEYFAQCDARET